MGPETTSVIKPGLDGVPVAESAVSLIDGKRARLEYRGIAVETLAEESSFEETAWLLLKGRLPNQKELAEFDDELRHHRRLKYKLIDLIKCLPETGHPMGFAQQAWSAAMFLYADHAVRTGKLPLFDDLLAAKPAPAVAAEMNDVVIRPGGGPV